jgi:hypothetical protein
MTGIAGELSLEQLLSDPLIVAMMRSDDVDRERLQRLVGETAKRRNSAALAALTIMDRRAA